MHSAKANVPLTSNTMHIHMPPDLRWWGGWVMRSSSSVTAWDTQQVWMTWSIVFSGYHDYVTTSALSQWLSMIHIFISAQYFKSSSTSNLCLEAPPRLPNLEAPPRAYSIHPAESLYDLYNLRVQHPQVEVHVSAEVIFSSWYDSVPW